VVERSGVYERASLVGNVALMSGGTTLYGLLGAWPGWVALLSIVAMAWGPARIGRGRRSVLRILDRKD
jgi:apolipoprotein N-acyltransferase